MPYQLMICNEALTGAYDVDMEFAHSLATWWHPYPFNPPSCRGLGWPSCPAQWTNNVWNGSACFSQAQTPLILRSIQRKQPTVLGVRSRDCMMDGCNNGSVALLGVFQLFPPSVCQLDETLRLPGAPVPNHGPPRVDLACLVV
jgi:hypothetical protein